jgi:hypothetical protein
MAQQNKLYFDSGYFRTLGEYVSEIERGWGVGLLLRNVPDIT